MAFRLGTIHGWPGHIAWAVERQRAVSNAVRCQTRPVTTPQRRSEVRPTEVFRKFRSGHRSSDHSFDGRLDSQGIIVPQYLSGPLNSSFRPVDPSRPKSESSGTRRPSPARRRCCGRRPGDLENGSPNGGLRQDARRKTNNNK